MSTNINPNEADLSDEDMNDNNHPGWFYHAPARRQHADPVLYPPMSQIPGLAEDDGLPSDPVRPLLKDSDTAYIRLAKQGGRANLLQMKENSKDKHEPVLYPRNEWFYLEDNAMEDEAEKNRNQIDYDFLRPDYMVHEGYKPEDSSLYERPARGPIGYDRLSVFERDSKNVTDKTVKLPEVRKPGYGIRSGKPLRIPKSQEKNKPPSAQTDPGRGPRPQKYLMMPNTPNNKEKPRINKILSYAYEKEWQEQLQDWQTKQDIGRFRHRNMTHVPPHIESKVQSEYSVNFGKSSTVVHSNMRQQGNEAQSLAPSEPKSAVRQNEAQRLREALLKKPEEKVPFKMTRFKNVPARIETHRPSQTAAC